MITVETGTRDRVLYFSKRLPVLFLLIKINEHTLNQTAEQIGWISTIILGFTCLYVGWFSLISIPATFFRWVTGQSPRYTPPPREKTPPEP